jgi:hypothetical protein
MPFAAIPAAFCGMPATSAPTMTSSSSTAATPLSTLATPTHPRDDFIQAFSAVFDRTTLKQLRGNRTTTAVSGPAAGKGFP